MFIWNEERFAFNIMDAEMLKKFNDTSKEMWKELEEYEKKNTTTGTIGEGTEKHTIFILTLIKKKKSIRVFMILVDFLLDKI